jgi:opacity protein-like surface antigen
MRAPLTIVSLVAALALAAGQAQAQELPISIDVAAGAAFPLGDLKARDGEGGAANTGFGFRIGGAYWLTPQIAAYAGYSRYSFGVDAEEFDEPGAEVDWVDSGFSAGVRLAFSDTGAEAQLSPWIEAGIAYRTLALAVSAEGVSGRLAFDRALGFEVAGGLNFGVAQRLVIGPAVQYTRYNPDPLLDPDFPNEEVQRSSIQHVTAELRASYRF